MLLSRKSTFVATVFITILCIACVVFSSQKQNDKPQITVIATYGLSGVTRTTSYSPGEHIFVRIRIDNARFSDDEAKTIYLESKLHHSDGELYKFVGGYLLNRGPEKGSTTDHVHHHFFIPPDTKPGEYLFRVTLHSDKTDRFESQGELKVIVTDNKTMRLNNPRLCVDDKSMWPSSGIFVSGQVIFHYCELEHATCVKNRVLMNLRTIIENENKEIVRDTSIPASQENIDYNSYPKTIPIQYSTSIAKEGNYTLKFIVTDKNSGQEASYTIPFRIVSRMDGS